MYVFYSKVTDRARRALEFANQHAKIRQHTLVTNCHLLWGLCEEGRNVASRVLTNLKVNLRGLQDQIDKDLGYGRYSSHGLGVPYADDARIAIVKAIDNVTTANYVGCQHFLLAILDNPDNPASRLLDKVNVTEELVLAEIKAIVRA